MRNLMMILCAFSLTAVLGCASTMNDSPVYIADPNCKLVSFKPGSEPDACNGVKWETQLSTLQGMKHVRTDPSHGGIEFYVRQGDAFKLENGKQLKIEYGFWKEKFYVGVITIREPDEWNVIKEAVFKKFGVGAKPFLNREEYLWVGKNIVMSLSYDENLKFGAYYMRSEAMEKKMAQK